VSIWPLTFLHEFRPVPIVPVGESLVIPRTADATGRRQIRKLFGFGHSGSERKRHHAQEQVWAIGHEPSGSREPDLKFRGENALAA
jgi:hypothetical protein